MRLLMRNLLSWIICSLLFVSSVFADYSSLTSAERELVREAFKKSRYYKYYETLVIGKDKIRITGVRKIKEIRKDNKTHYVYEFKVDLIIMDQVFKRKQRFEFDLNINIEENFGFNWHTVETMGKYIIIFLGGFLLGNVSAN